MTRWQLDRVVMQSGSFGLTQGMLQHLKRSSPRAHHVFETGMVAWDVEPKEG
jgi:hypothetical protein